MTMVSPARLLATKTDSRQQQCTHPPHAAPTRDVHRTLGLKGTTIHKKPSTLKNSVLSRRYTTFSFMVAIPAEVLRAMRSSPRPQRRTQTMND